MTRKSFNHHSCGTDNDNDNLFETTIIPNSQQLHTSPSSEVAKPKITYLYQTPLTRTSQNGVSRTWTSVVLQLTTALADLDRYVAQKEFLF
jgi:hypothetical protein